MCPVGPLVSSHFNKHRCWAKENTGKAARCYCKENKFNVLKMAFRVRRGRLLLSSCSVLFTVALIIFLSELQPCFTWAASWNFCSLFILPTHYNVCHERKAKAEPKCEMCLSQCKGEACVTLGATCWNDLSLKCFLSLDPAHKLSSREDSATARSWGPQSGPRRQGPHGIWVNYAALLFLFCFVLKDEQQVDQIAETRVFNGDVERKNHLIKFNATLNLAWIKRAAGK